MLTLIALIFTMLCWLKSKYIERFRILSESCLPSSAGDKKNTVQWIYLKHQQYKEYPQIQAEVRFKSHVLDRLHSLSVVLGHTFYFYTSYTPQV